MKSLSDNKNITNVLGRVLFWVAWPAIWLTIKHGSRTRVLLVVGNNVLLVKPWLGIGYWTLPGGGLHKSEPPAQGAARELYEETGVTVKTKELVYLGKSHGKEFGLKYKYHKFVVQVQKLPVLHLQRSELIEASWLPLDTICDNPQVSQVTKDVARAWLERSNLVD